MSKQSKSIIPASRIRIEQAIFMIRNEKVILDQDLAVLYGVETRVLIISWSTTITLPRQRQL